MKRLVTPIVAFLLGGGIASAAWGLYFFKTQTDWATAAVSVREGDAHFGEMVLDYIDAPDKQKAARLNFTSTNMVAGFLNAVDMCERHFSYVHAKSRFSAEYQRYQTFLDEREARLRLPLNSNNPP